MVREACMLLAALSLCACAAGEDSTDSAVSRTEGTEAEAAEETNQDESALKITVRGQELLATLEDNSSAEAFRELLSQGPLTIEMEDYGGFEKVGPWARRCPGTIPGSPPSPGT